MRGVGRLRTRAGGGEGGGAISIRSIATRIVRSAGAAGVRTGGAVFATGSTTGSDDVSAWSSTRWLCTALCGTGCGSGACGGGSDASVAGEETFDGKATFAGESEAAGVAAAAGEGATAVGDGTMS